MSTTQTHAARVAASSDRAALSQASLVRIQAASGLVFAVFGALHLVNTALGAFGPETYNAYQRALRPIYQYPLVEVSLILVPLLVHAAASIARMWARRGVRVRCDAKTRAHRYAGWFLLATMTGHVTATRASAILEGAFPEFEGVAFTFQFMPGFFYPYYVLLGLAGTVHLLIGAPTALGRLGIRVPLAWQRGAGARALVVVACAAVLLGVVGLGGLLFPVGELGSHPFAIFVQETYGDVFGAAGVGD